MSFYNAPWSNSLRITSSVITVLLAGVSLALTRHLTGSASWLGFLPLAILLCSAPFAVRGYTITPDAILVHRLFWRTRLALSDLESVRYEPGVMRGSLRIFGNGGLFSITGIFRNKTLGVYRAFATDPLRTVVLQFPTRTVLLSPSSPERFVHEVRQMLAPSPSSPHRAAAPRSLSGF